MVTGRSRQQGQLVQRRVEIGVAANVDTHQHHARQPAACGVTMRRGRSEVSTQVDRLW
jgi:hypothetical protein